MSDNPLFKYHTQPGTFVKLPSEGRFYNNPPKLIDGEIEVKPMNAVDELQFQNPDSLLNNEALFQVIGRCVPDIPNPREILRPDMDVLLLGLRVATYGDSMEVSATCSECGKTETYVTNLSTMLAKARNIEGKTSIEIDELIVHIKPFSVSSQQKLGETMVNVRRMANDLARKVKGDETDDVIIEKIKSEMAAQVNAGALEIFDNAVNSIDRIDTPDGVVTEKEHIKEWLQSIKAPTYKKIRDAIAILSEETIDRNMTYTCKHCQAENTVEVQFDPANFSGLNSEKQ